jgi:hypothetical protein
MQINETDILFFLSDDSSKYISTISLDQGVSFILEVNRAPRGMYSIIIRMDSIVESRGCGNIEGCHCNKLISMVPDPDQSTVIEVIRNNCPVRSLTSAGKSFICELSAPVIGEDFEAGSNLDVAPYLMSRLAEDFRAGKLPVTMLTAASFFRDFIEKIERGTSFIFISREKVVQILREASRSQNIDNILMPSLALH